MFNNKIKTESPPGYGLAIPSCEALVDASNNSGIYNDHNRYGLMIPSGQPVKRKLFAEDEPLSHSNSSNIPSDFNSRKRYHQSNSTNQNNVKYDQKSMPQQSQSLHEYPKRIPLGNGISQIAIRKKHNDSPTGWNNEVFLLNGNWDTSHSIPNIVAEMHNVNLAELQGTWGGDDGDTLTASCVNGGQTISTIITNDSRDGKNSDNLQSIHQQRIDNNHRALTGLPTNDANQDFNGDDNFQWLVNFKLDDLIHASTPTSSSSSDYTNTTLTNSNRSQQSMVMQTNTSNSIRSINMNPNYSQHVYITDVNSLPNQYFTQNQLKNIIQENRTNNLQSRQLSQQQHQQPAAVTVKTMKHTSLPGANNINGNNQGNHTSRYSGPRKPPFTYTELIEHALREKGELTVSGIYQWISDHFPFYKANDDRWKNSVRHNLSINPHFRKGSKAVHGAGHLWTIAQRDDKRMSTWIMKKQRMQQFIDKYDEKEKAMEDELQAATASILPEMDCGYLQTDVNIQNSNSSNQRMGHNVIRTSDDSSSIKREVEVQYLIPVSDSMDFMCPVSKEQVAEECGLQQSCNSNDDNKTEQQRVNELTSGDYLITDLNPQTLGLNLSEAEIITPDQLFGDDLNFQCYELQV
ncbi:forkhead box protein N4-like [Chrysoperla carnea]|uniref:forkhead box protein N4-like n=1 Tax=Chrysoperla carnea TaxID=189513 RepID=UPI001D080654|nr:forkhead box protein N4-like [Chrysoperla carnea]